MLMMMVMVMLLPQMSAATLSLQPMHLSDSSSCVCSALVRMSALLLVSGTAFRSLSNPIFGLTLKPLTEPRMTMFDF